jgi:hypothetical protein
MRHNARSCAILRTPADATPHWPSLCMRPYATKGSRPAGRFVCVAALAFGVDPWSGWGGVSEPSRQGVSPFPATSSPLVHSTPGLPFPERFSFAMPKRGRGSKSSCGTPKPSSAVQRLRERGTAGAGGDSPTEKEAPLQAIDLYIHLEHDLILPPHLEAPQARARCTRCGASALTKKRSHGSSGLDWLRGTRCKGAARGQEPAKADPSGTLSLGDRAAAMRAHNAKLQRERRAKGSCLNKLQNGYKRCLGWQESGVYDLCIFNTIEPGERAHTRQKCVFCAPNNMLRAISTAKGRGAVLRLLKKFYAARVTHPAVYTTALQRLEGQASADMYEQMRKSAGTAGAEDREAWETALKKICIRACEGAQGTAASGR